MKKLTILFVLFFTFATQANAAITTFNSEASWLAAVGPGSVLEDFNNASLAAPLTSITGGTFPAAGSYAFAGQQVFHAVASSTNVITFNFSTAISGLGGLWDLAGPGGPGTNLTLNLVGGGTEVFTDYFSNTLAGTFRGFVASSAFNSMTLRMGTECCVETFELENLRMSPVNPVPEPETYAMLLIGLGLIGFITYRKKNNKNNDSRMMMAA
jgi:hypothetical protein